MESTLSHLNVSNQHESGYNSSSEKNRFELQDLIDQYSRNRNIEDPAYHILIILYGVLIIVGAIGNSLVVIAVARKPTMRTARNMFILNLAVSDLLLCCLTMPLTLVEILSKYWPLGKHVFLCKIIGTLQATSIFVSTISITAIALDRYQVIVYPTKNNLQTMGAVFILTGIWALALFLASPLYIIRSLIHYEINILNIHTISYCIEDWPIENGRIIYSLFSLCVQYFLPIIIVSAAYLRIYLKLKNRLVVAQNHSTPAREGKSDREIGKERVRERGRRMQRTNYLLISISIIFCISWMPLNLFNLYADLYMSSSPRTQNFMILFAICHMMGMTSSFSNPLLYGYFNNTFRTEFREILCQQKMTGNNSILLKLKNTSSTGIGRKKKRKHEEGDPSQHYEFIKVKECSMLQEENETLFNKIND